MKVSFLVAMYNEGENATKTLAELHGYATKSLKGCETEIIAVDDASSDGTYERLLAARKKYGIIADRNPVNMGQGASFRRGIGHATGDVVITLDSDLSYPLSDVPKMLEKIRHGYDVVITSPFMAGGKVVGVPQNRIILSRVAALLYSIALGMNLTCFTGAFRAYRTGLIKKLEYKSDRFDAQVEILWLCKRNRARIVEVPSTLTSKYLRKSSFKLSKVIMENLKLIARLSANRLASIGR